MNFFSNLDKRPSNLASSHACPKRGHLPASADVIPQAARCQSHWTGRNLLLCVCVWPLHQKLCCSARWVAGYAQGSVAPDSKPSPRSPVQTSWPSRWLGRQWRPELPECTSGNRAHERIECQVSCVLLNAWPCKPIKLRLYIIMWSVPAAYTATRRLLPKNVAQMLLLLLGLLEDHQTFGRGHAVEKDSASQGHHARGLLIWSEFGKIANWVGHGILGHNGKLAVFLHPILDVLLPLPGPDVSKTKGNKSVLDQTLFAMMISWQYGPNTKPGSKCNWKIIEQRGSADVSGGTWCPDLLRGPLCPGLEAAAWGSPCRW